MGTKVVQRPVLTFWEKLYLPQILSGLKITSVHFFRNLFLHSAHRLGASSTCAPRRRSSSRRSCDPCSRATAVATA